MAQEITLDYYQDIYSRHIHIYIHTHIYVYIYIYMCIYVFQVMIKVCFFLFLIAGCCVFFEERTCGGEGS